MKNRKAFSLIELSIVILVIGILVIGITQGSRIIAESKAKSAKTLTAGSIVNSMSGLVLWLDATDSSTIATGTAGSGVYTGAPDDNSDVTNWKEHNPQTTTPKVLSALAAGNRPKYIKNGINGLPTLQFDGVAQYLQNSTGVIASGKNMYTLIAVWQSSLLSSNRLIFGQDGASAACNGTYAGILTNGTTIRHRGCGGGYDPTHSSVAINIPYIAISVINKNNSNWSVMYLNSASSAATATLGILESGPISVGGYSNGSGGFFRGYISEIIIFDRAITNIELVSVQNYLSSKYAIRLD